MSSGKNKPKGKRNTGKIIFWVGFGAGFLFLANKAWGAYSRAKETAADLTVETSGRIHKIDLSGITLAVDVRVKNPNRAAITFRHPFVKLIYQGKDLLSSELNQTLYPIASYEEKPFTVYFKTTLLNISMMAASLYKSYLQSGVLNLTVFTKVEIYSLADHTFKEPIVFPKTEEMSFGKGSQKQLPA
jgi:hypothetical protein